MALSKSEVKKNNDALVTVLCVSVAHAVSSFQLMIIYMLNTGFGFLFSVEMRQFLIGKH